MRLECDVLELSGVNQLIWLEGLTSTSTLAFGHRLRGKEGDSYGAMQEKPLA